ncbi:MAG: GrpB family protein [Actinobacteria bacterium]|nr:GrpB family protein [Actinomycetota bacterium]
MSDRPLVALVGYHLEKDRVARWPFGGYGVPAPFVDRLRAAGARTAIVSPGEAGDPEELLSPFDGLVLVGGGDVDPSRYGAEPDAEHNYGIEPDRDELEIGLLRAADRLALPTLCVCRGMQVMNVAFGGTLHQHLPAMAGMIEHGVPVADTQTMHDVRVSPGSRLLATAGVETLSCSSHHHQGVDRVGEGLLATGWSDDGLVEAVERAVDDPYAGVWMVGVQWHPEDTAPEDPAQQALFDALTSLARWRSSRAKPGEMEGRGREYGMLDHDPAWRSWFEEEAAAIREALGDLALRIEHVGSTSVPGLAAKPVIDVQVSVETLTPRAPLVEPLKAIGYVHAIDPIETEHDFLYRGRDDGFPHQVHLHLCPAGSVWERRHLAFRDWLRAHPEDAEAYARLKRELAARHSPDIQAYVDGEAAFVRSVQERAEAGAAP